MSPTQLDTVRSKAHVSMLGIVEKITAMSAELYEITRGAEKGVLSSRGVRGFEPYCQYIRDLPGGESTCERDHCHRVEEAVREGKERLTLCWAGLYSLALPISASGEVRVVILYGQMRIDDDDHKRVALAKHLAAAQELGLKEDQQRTLMRHFNHVNKLPLDKIPSVQEVVPEAEQWFVSLLDEEDRLKARADRVAHEVQTRLQAILADADNLLSRIKGHGLEQAEREARSVLQNTKAISSGIQVLGKFLENYRFHSEPLLPLLYEAREIYEAEASRRYIHIYVTPEGVAGGRLPVIEISKPHLQHAINNLVHNAVKYSFTGSEDNPRHVTIGGKGASSDYCLTIENYGVGILKREIDNGELFKDGYQGELTGEEYRSGSGMGLGFVREVVEAHNGRIEIESYQLTDSPSPEGEPFLNRFNVFLPYKQHRRR